MELTEEQLRERYAATETQDLSARRSFRVVVVLLWLVPGWSSEVTLSSTDAQPIPRAVADASESEFMLAEAGYLTATEFFVKYRIGDEVRYSGGNWRSQVLLADTPDEGRADYTVPSVLPLEYHQAEPWDALPEDARPVRIFGVERWRELRDRLLVSVLPTTERAGVVL